MLLSCNSHLDKVFSINLSGKVFIFQDFNAHHKGWLNLSWGTDRPGEIFCYFQPISSNLTQIGTFPTWIWDWFAQSCPVPVQLSFILVFLSVCVASLAHRINVFSLYQQNKGKGKRKFIQASNCCKKFIETVKLAYANKAKDFITFQKL